ncbi:ABC transporter permease [Streptomyces yaizuensis]|uniref:Transport permease protein n=1 Tax=Streptomyces yaizuensis TaxID=2989713 RepID=A0ABQ5PAJ3_9ACTN|nr:ABC transporter permease [Streptomyces sp. YSPA8]GLF99619.1 ABC transporter permease [Streptomyces sp. YSPA8]
MTTRTRPRTRALPLSRTRTRTRTRTTSVKGSATAVLKTETRLLLREPAALFWVLAFPTLLLCILGAIPSNREHSTDLGGLRVVDLYVPIAVLLAVLTAGLQTMPPVLTGYRERGILRRMSTTPIRPGSLIGAQIALHGAAVALSSLLALAVGRIVFDVALPRHLVGYGVALALVTLATLALGATVSAVCRTTKITQAVGSAVFFPAMFTAGVWMPVATMPDLLRHLVTLTPPGAAARALDATAAGQWPSWTHLGIMALWAVLLIAAARRWFTWE